MYVCMYVCVCVCVCVESSRVLISPGLLIRFFLVYLLNSYINYKEERIISPGLVLSQLCLAAKVPTW